MTLYTLYIGSDNTTGKLDIVRILKITSFYFESYTYSTASGVWKGKEENTCKLEIVTEDLSKIESLAIELKAVLSQESVMVFAEHGKVSFI